MFHIYKISNKSYKSFGHFDHFGGSSVKKQTCA